MTKCNSCGGTTVFISGNIVRCEYCGKLYETSNGELNIADPERLYISAVSMLKSNNEDNLESATETFEALGSYKDSFALANSCRGMIAQSRVEAEERRLAAVRQAELERIESEKRTFEEKQKAKIRGIVIAAVSAVAVIAVAISVISNSNKSSSYNKAMELYSAGQYEEAREAFNDLGDYSDATTYVSTIDNFLTERESKYEKGVSYYEKGAYNECITSLTDIFDYLDSADYIEKSVEAIYLQATEHYNAGDYEKAKELLGKIPVSSSKSMDAELLLADIEEIIIEQTNAATYEQAKGFYDNGDYETAQRLFMSLGNYEESKTYLYSIGESYYKQAQELYSKGDYAGCGDKLEYIDTVNEWSEYSVAVNLKQQATDTYSNLIKEEARNICRKESVVEMNNYVNNAICSVLSQEQAEILKEECKVEKISFETLTPYVYGTYKLDARKQATDTMGNNYSYAFIANGRDFSGTYCIDGKYSTFSGTIAVWKTDVINETGSIRIYGDDVLLWADENITKSTKPYSIEVDVTGVTDLKIQMYGSDTFGRPGGITVILGDPMLIE